MFADLNRRSLMQGGLALLAIPGSTFASTLDDDPVIHRYSFKLVETAGLRRFGFPISTVFSNVGKFKDFRLTRQGKSVPAQFRRVDRPGLKDAVALDFNTDVGPLGVEEYEVVYGKDVEAGPEPRAGLKLERETNLLRVGHRAGLHWELPLSQANWLTKAADGRREYLRSGPAVLSMKLAEGSVRSLGEQEPGIRPNTLKVDREGPLAISLRHESEISRASQAGLHSVVSLDFVASKSWVEVRWELDDPGGVVRELGFELPLKLEGPPILVDFGASSLVYEQMRMDESTALIAGPAHSPAWTITRQSKSGLASSYACAAPDDHRPVEGWAHVFDKTRCTALAVADFGRSTSDRIQIDGDGKLSGRRVFVPTKTGIPPGGKKQIRFWVHVVPTPVQVGAATSPQAILGWPKVEWSQPGS